MRERLRPFYNTKVGRMVTLAPRGDGEEWEGLGGIELWPKGEGQEICGDGGGPGPS